MQLDDLGQGQYLWFLARCVFRDNIIADLVLLIARVRMTTDCETKKKDEHVPSDILTALQHLYWSSESFRCKQAELEWGPI